MSDDLCQCQNCGRMHKRLGTPPLSVMEQIARDMKQGDFPNKSKDTLLEEAAERIEALEAALRDAAVTPTAWRVWWVSLNTARTELFEDHAKATAKARETGGCVTPLFTRAALAPEQDK
jgi:hypothetical protein